MAALTGIVKGQPKKVVLSLGDEPLRNPPDWELRDWDDEVLASGVATDEGNNRWSATFTIAKNLNIPNNVQDLEIEFDAITLSGKYRSKSRMLTIVDVADDWRSYGILHYPKGGMPQRIRESILLPYKASRITAEIRDGYGEGNLLYTASTVAPVEKSSSDLGWAYDVDITNVALPYASGGYYPHQLVLSVEFEDGTQDMIVKPIYTLTPISLSMLTSVKRYLDKARLEEIDPNVGWQDEEIIHYLLQGAQIINGFNEVSYWTIDSMPPTLHAHLQKAAEWEALNARYMAEGYVEFDWQGANTQLSVNRKEVIQTKMDEINSWLNERLPNAKKSALQHFGPGTPPPGVQAGRRAIGGLFISVSPTTNVVVPARRRLTNRAGGYGY